MTVVADGDLYTWGNGRDGQDVPRVVEALRGKHITAVAAGANHTAVVADGELYTWGSGS